MRRLRHTHTHPSPRTHIVPFYFVTMISRRTSRTSATPGLTEFPHLGVGSSILAPESIMGIRPAPVGALPLFGRALERPHAVHDSQRLYLDLGKQFEAGPALSRLIPPYPALPNQ